MTAAITDITTVVGNVITMMTTGELAIFFYAGVVGIAIGIVSKMKRK